MNLRDYLHFERMMLKDFAEKCEYTRTHIGGCMAGRLKPSKKFMRIVSRVTNGKVNEEDWAKDKL